MNKNLFLRLCLIMMTVLSIASCRTDHIPESEASNPNTGKFQLSSKRISLNEAKHKELLYPEIEKAESAFKSLSEKIANGKTVNYGNGVSIDTDNVIYIENGPNFHTYTFHIKRENSPDAAPLENLLLVPTADGSYKEFLVTYNLTVQEREKVRNGEPVNTKGKTTVTELTKGSYNSGGQLAKMSCNWTEETIVQGCSHIVKGQSFHNATNIDDWINCTADVKPSIYTVVTGGCNTEQPEFIDPGSSGGGGNGGGGDPGNPPDDNCSGVASNPGEVGLVNGNGCNVGVPTQPNDTRPGQNPCEKTKAMLQKPEVKAKIDSLKKKSVTGGELGVKIKNDGTTSTYIDGGEHHVNLGNLAGWQTAYHNHTPTGIPMQSPPDISTLFSLANAQLANYVKDAALGMIVKKPCTSCADGTRLYHYVIRFNGTFNDAQVDFSENELDEYNEFVIEQANVLALNTLYSDNHLDLNNKGVEKLFFDTLATMNISPNVIELQRIAEDINGNYTEISNISLDANGEPIETPCL